MKKEEFIRAGCNLSIAIILIGIIICTFADTKELVIAAVALMFFGLAFGIPFGFAMEKRKPLPRKVKRPQWEKQDQQDLQDGKFNYIYQPEYPFFAYLSDNDTTLQELIAIIDSDTDPAKLFKEIYANYCANARGSRVQTVEQIQSMIWRERRRCG